jgi:ABC-type iron transport system FetAB permease component
VGNTWVIVTCAVLFVIEFFADKIPGFDVIWNGLQTVVRIPIAGLIAYHASSQLSPSMQLLATAIGAGIALATHSSKTLARTAVTPSPEPFSNIALSSVEDVVAIGITWFATTHPIVAATIAGCILIATFFVGRALFRAIRRSMQKLFGTDEDDAVRTEQKPLG